MNFPLGGAGRVRFFCYLKCKCKCLLSWVDPKIRMLNLPGFPYESQTLISITNPSNPSNISNTNLSKLWALLVLQTWKWPVIFEHQLNEIYPVIHLDDKEVKLIWFQSSNLWCMACSPAAFVLASISSQTLSPRWRCSAWPKDWYTWGRLQKKCPLQTIMKYFKNYNTLNRIFKFVKWFRKTFLFINLKR